MRSDLRQRLNEPTVTFWGAAESVTGSMHLLEWGGRRVLLDCGLVRGRRDEERQRNGRFPFDPASLDAVVLSHAHSDHCGNLPNLVRQGFQGPIFCTAATRDLLAVILPDSARIQEEEAVVAATVGRPGADKGPMFDRSDAGLTVSRCVTVSYGATAEVVAGLRLRFLDAGHILGSAVVCLTADSGGREHTITFTGDLGRRGLPYLNDPPSVPAADLLVCESTYGGRTHDTVDAMAAKVADVVTRTAERGGKVLIPAFSLGRTQVVLHFLRRWTEQGLLPSLPLYVDSPLAARVAGVYERYPTAFLPGQAPGGPAPHYLGSREETDDVTKRPGPAVIVASGGMCDGGRVLHHLRHHVDDPRASILLVSYQAPGSLGAQLLEFNPTVRFMGKKWNKWAEVTQVSGFSGHADQNDFVALLGPAAPRTRRVRLVHGEPDQSAALAGTLRKHGFADVSVARREETASAA
jgi:metallo-beta-lactamase family protein